MNVGAIILSHHILKTHHMVTCIQAENRVDLRIESTAELILTELKNGDCLILAAISIIFWIFLTIDLESDIFCPTLAKECIVLFWCEVIDGERKKSART